MGSFAALPAILLFLWTALAGVAVAVTDGLLPNGNFELGPSTSDMNGTQVVSKFAIPNWEIFGFVEYIKAGQKQGDMVLVVPEGAFAVRLGNEASVIQQLPNLRVGMYYSLTLSAARTCAQRERLSVALGPESDVFPIQTVYSSTGWDSYAIGFQAVNATATLVIHNLGVEDDPACGPLIDSVAIRTLYPPRKTNQNLLKNGNFEEGPYIIPNTSYGVLIPPITMDRHSPLPGWIVESLKSVKYIDSTHFSVPQGRRAVEIVAGRESAISQVVRTIPGKLYSLAFSVGDASNTCVGSMVVEAFAGAATVKVPYESSGSGGFKRAELRFTATAARTRVTFYSTFYHTSTDATLCGPVIDDVRLLSVRQRALL